MRLILDTNEHGGNTDAKSQAASSGEPGPTARVLVVEDHPTLRATLEAFLECHGYAVTTAASYEQALQVARSAPPDVAVCDRQLEGHRDGIDVARELQKCFGAGVVFVSGTSVDRLRAESVDLDVCAYIRKPARPGEIETAVRRAAASR